ncbi:hypothetical protein P3W45_001096 [Vairimorpha bombi]|jgi:origin recognition complex subunit 4
MKNFIKKIYRNEVKSIQKYLMDNTNILISSIDGYITSVVISEVSNFFIKKNWNIEFVVSKKDIKENTLVVINAEGNQSLSSSIFLYYYLELCEKKVCKIILYSKSCLVIDNMEKRVRSRFSNQICILKSIERSKHLDLYKYLVKSKKHSFLDSLTQLDEVNFQYDVDPSVNVLVNLLNMWEYKFEKFTINTAFSMLNNIHIAILILSSHKPLLSSTVVTEFKKFILRCKELKKSTNKDIFTAYCDIVDFGFINERGNLLFDVSDLKNYITSNSPQYIKKLRNYIEK